MSAHFHAAECPEPYSAKYRGSFAFLTIKDRLPVILTKVIDSVCRDKHVICTAYGEVAKEESKAIVGRLSALQNEMVTNKPVIPLVSDGVNVGIWNEYLKKESEEHDYAPAWFDSSWLYVECYLYRRIKQAFELSTMLRHYDPFRQQKQDAFLASIDGAISLATALQQVSSEVHLSECKMLYDYFATFLEVSLWGNKCDLSISAGKENCQLGDNPLSHLGQLRDQIVLNDTETVWARLVEANKRHPGEVCLDFVLDNSGFELFSDLCFLHFLKASSLVNRVRIYVKTMPWFVSDATTEDVEWLLETLSKSETDVLVQLGNQWKDNIQSDRWTLEVEDFWTLPHDYSQMSAIDSRLYSKLSESDLVVFKGDLNYRKLTGDRQWDEDTSFLTSLRGFLPNSLVSLRTVKGNVIVGLKPGTTDKLNEKSENWKFTGDFAVVQCASKT